MSEPNDLYLTISSILNALFEREQEFLVKREHDMIVRNTQLGGSPDGFRHMGFIFTELTGAGRSRGKYDRLHPSLVQEMDTLDNDRKIIKSDRDRISQALTLVLRGCETLQDMRDAMPNSLKEFVPGCSRLERSRKEAYTIEDNPRSYTQYMRLREKIDYYVATRLLY